MSFSNYYYCCGGEAPLLNPARPRSSWDRMPFLTNIASGGGEASYAPALNEATALFIIANYGSAQGYDNDDGSVRAFSLRAHFHCAPLRTALFTFNACPLSATEPRLHPPQLHVPGGWLQNGLWRIGLHFRLERGDCAAL